MGHFDDFLDTLLGNNVMRDMSKLISEISMHEAQSQIDNNEWHNRIRHCQRAYKITQQQISRNRRDLRIKQK